MKVIKDVDDIDGFCIFTNCNKIILMDLLLLLSSRDVKAL
jgi:hypothetical protein